MKRRLADVLIIDFSRDYPGLSDTKLGTDLLIQADSSSSVFLNSDPSSELSVYHTWTSASRRPWSEFLEQCSR